MDGYQEELRFARELAEAGARVALGHYQRDPEVKKKSDGTWVTEADWKAEAQIRLRIARSFGQHNVLGEEEGLTAAGGGPAIVGAPTWVIDPIDGTNNFMSGIPCWATLVGLRIGDETVVGVCHAPVLGETYEAARGRGATMNGDPIHVAPNEKLDDATLLFASVQSYQEAGLKDFFDALVTRTWRSRGFGDFWGHMLVARGAAQVMIEPDLAVWDVAALQVIVEEAGGKTTHLKGERWVDRGSCLTTNGRLHEQVVALAEEFAPTWSENQFSG